MKLFKITYRYVEGEKIAYVAAPTMPKAVVEVSRWDYTIDKIERMGEVVVVGE